MPLTLNVGLSKKIGLPDYGSLGASCNVQVELEATLLQHDLDSFHRHVRNAFAACAQAVTEDLARQQYSAENSHVPISPVRNGKPSSPPSNGHADRSTHTSAGSNHRATTKQLDYAHQLAGQIKGIGVRKLESLAGRMYGKPLADLSSLEASGLIDTLKAIKAGDVSLASALQELSEAA